MKQPEDRATVDWVGGTHHGRGRRRGQRVGPYCKRYETAATVARASTGLTMVEFALAAGISERTLRNWEGRVGCQTPEVVKAITDTLRKHKADGQAMARAMLQQRGAS